MKIKAVIFDMDGVLIDAKEWHFEALNKALGLFGMEISRYDHMVTYDGLPTQKKLDMLTREKGLPVSLHKFINRLKQTYTMDLVHTKCKPVFYHQYALSKLIQEGYKLAVCSNSIKASLDIMMQRANLSEHFEFTLSNQDVSMPKPHPEIYTKAMARLGLRPQECLVVEDNENGVKAAMGSGAHIMRVYSVDEVNYQKIKQKITMIEESKDAD